MENKTPLNPIQARLQAQRSQDTLTRPSPSSSARAPASSLPQPRHTQRPAVPTRGPQISVNGTAPQVSFPAPNSAQRAGARRKVALDQGCSPLDWARLNSSGQNLRGIDPRDFPVRVTKDILKTHNTEKDCWTVLKGKVYNLTPYVRFHPGGIEEIMKCAGKDGTLLFMKYHAWVNYERMLENCWVGIYMG